MRRFILKRLPDGCPGQYLTWTWGQCLPAGDVGEKADSGIGLDQIFQIALHAVDRDKADLCGIQTDQLRNVPRRDGS
jgi:hypothetical protein